jgi:phosphopantetheinyl transferase (holo-ACP synthase)
MRAPDTSGPVSGELPAVVVQSMFSADREELVFYGSLARDAESCRHQLICTLWEHLLERQAPLWKHCQAPGGASFPVRVSSGSLGRPHFLVGEFPGPAISFSEGGGQVWAALSGNGSDVGIDVAGADEFTPNYPVHRVFHPDELQHAVQLTKGNRASACALLWSVKEAFVKALGCGFHLVDPRQIKVSPVAGGAPGRDGGYVFPVGLSARTQVQFPPYASRPILVHARPLSQLWLSIAHLNRRAV